MSMRPIFVCADALLWTLMSAADAGSTRATFIVETPKLRTRIGRHGARVITGDLEGEDRKSTRLNSSHIQKSRMPSSA